MSETDQAQKKQRFLLMLILLLFVIIGGQAWHMLTLEQQLNVLNAQNNTSQQSAEIAAAQEDENVAAPADEDDAMQPAENTSSQTAEDKTALTTEEPKPNTTEGDTSDDSPAELASPDEYDIFNPPFYGLTSDPYEEIRRMQEHMDRVFNERFMRMDRRPDFEHHFRQRVVAPKIKVEEDAKRYMVYVNVPGTDEDNISVRLDGQRLTIRAKQGYQKRESDPSGNYMYSESRSGSFKRSITLREPIINNGMKSRYENGVLIIMIPKAQW